MRKSFVKWGGVFSIVSLLMFLLFASCSGGTDYVGTSSGGSGDYKITISTETKTGGTVTADKENAAEGDIVTLTVTPEPGYELDTLTVKDADGKAVAVSRVDGTAGDVLLMEASVASSSVTVAVVRYSFKMPKTNVTVSATFKKSGTEKEPETVTYSVSIGEMTNGTVTAKVGGVEATQAVSGETVTLTATPSGTVRLKSLKIDGTEQVASVTAGTREFTFAMPAKNVTVTAEFGWIGTKEPSEAKAVGDIVFNDGSAEAGGASVTLTDEQKAAAVAVIFLVDGTKKLGVGLKQGTSLKWAESGKTGDITALQCTPSEYGDGRAGSTTNSFTGTTDGSTSLATFRTAVSASDGTSLSSTDYPAWSWIESYATTANLTGTYASDWYMPSIKELCDLYKAKDVVNTSINNAGGTQIGTQRSTGYFWSSSQRASDNLCAWYVYFWSGILNYGDKNSTISVCAVRAF